MLDQMKWASTVREIQLDATSYCNAGCGTCVRFKVGSWDLHQSIVLEHFDMDTWTKLVTKDIKDTRIDTIFFNGNWGDACMHPKLIDMVKLALEENPKLGIKISTNGSLRTTKWWEELARVLGKRGHVIFCIEGVDQETHGKYRQKTFYKKIIENLTAFNNAGGNSVWMMTAFDHNIHQIDQARELAKQLGCARYTSRRSHDDNIVFETHNVTTDNVKKEHIGITSFGPVHFSPVDAKQFPDQVSTQCSFYKIGSIQIDPHGTVWPCCYISQYRWGMEEDGKDLKTPELNDNAPFLSEKFNLKNKALTDILQDVWYANKLAGAINTASWDVCTRNCKIKPVVEEI